MAAPGARPQRPGYRNPILPGFYPDPSVCRVGRDYYLATSSFEYFPGVPLFHSTDVINWTQIGHCLSRPAQVDLEAIPPSQGIYAPTLRYHDGTFFMITTNVGKCGNFFVTARAPAGPWSDPVCVDADGWDPSLLFDDDGCVYYTRRGHGGLVQAEIDMCTGRLRSAPRLISTGFLSADQIEAPHLYKIRGTYYLLAAEGGTRSSHAVVVGRAASPRGPFEHCPHNPILTHRNEFVWNIRDVGHGDLVQDHHGHWWLVCLGTRHNRYDPSAPLGRETFLVPVEWTDDGWPSIPDRGRVRAEYQGARPPAAPVPECRHDDFAAPALDPCWNNLRNPAPDSWSLTMRPGWLRLHGSAAGLTDVGAPAFVGRRQQHFRFTAAASLEFEPATAAEEAGLVLFTNNRFHYKLCVTRRRNAPCVVLQRRVGDLMQERLSSPLRAGAAVELTITGTENEYRFRARQDDLVLDLGTALVRLIAPEIAGELHCWTGVYIAMFATGNGRACRTAADFDWFRYAPSAGEAKS